MKKIFLKSFTVLFSLWLAFGFFSEKADAQTYWGGLNAINYTGVCDCSEAIWTWFTPLYLTFPSTGAITWYEGELEFPSYVINDKGSVLGSYIPGVQGCWFYLYYGCIPLPAWGHVGPTTGSSPA